MTCIALITNTPPPYRVPIFNRLARWPGVDFHAVFCSAREPNRQWDLPSMQFERHWLRERFRAPVVWSPEFGDEEDKNFSGRDPVPAAVLVPLVVREEGLRMLLTMRTAHLHDHAGQISFQIGRAHV